MCPGRTGKKCGVFMSPLIRDPHIHCPRCRGNKCTIDTTCIICKSWPPEQWELFVKKESYAHSKARRDRSVSLSASPAPSVVGTSVGRPSVPPVSPPPSRDQVVMGGQPSVGVSVGCVGSAPSGSVTMATGCVSDDVAASPVPPPASGGEGGQERLPPRLLPHPWTEFYSASFSHQESEACRHFWLRPLWPFSLSLYGERARREAAR